MEYSIDGEDVSHSPRTQEKSQNDQPDFLKVVFNLLRWTQRQPRNINHNNRSNQPTVVSSNKVRESKKDVLAFALLLFMRVSSKSVRRKSSKGLNSTSYPSRESSLKKLRKTLTFTVPFGY